jgi:hypothetical protein
VSVLIGAGDGTFGPAVDYPVGANPTGITAADFDGDSDIDIATANFGGASASVLLNNGNGTFSPATTFAAGVNPYAVTAADLDGDSDADLAVGAQGTNSLMILLNNGNAGFSSPVGYAISGNPYAVLPGDFDGDGDVDLATPNFTTNDVSVFLNNGDGTMAPRVDYGAGPLPAGGVAADFDDDGVIDIAVSDYGSDSSAVLTGNGDGTFVPASAFFPTTTLPRSGASADFNADGAADFAVVSDITNFAAVQLGDGAGALGAPTELATEVLPVSVSDGDFNQDGKPDLAVANAVSDSVSVLLNAGTPTAYTDADALAFGRRALGTTTFRTVSFTNGGSARLEITAPSLAGAGSTQYSMGTDNCSGGTLLVGESCSVEIRFEPDAVGFAPARLVLSSNAPDSPRSVALGGFGFDGTLTVTTAGDGDGRVTSEPAGIDCSTQGTAGCSHAFDEGEEVTLTAEAEPGSTFAGWQGSACSGTGACVVTIDGPHDVTATFTSDTPPPDNPPEITSLRVTPKSFKPSSKPTDLGAARKKGAEVEITISEDSRVRFRVKNRPSGPGGGPPPKNPKVFKRNLEAGSSSIRFTGTLGKRTFKPGKYKIVARARDSAGQKSEKVAANFRVLK